MIDGRTANGCGNYLLERQSTIRIQGWEEKEEEDSKQRDSSLRLQRRQWEKGRMAHILVLTYQHFPKQHIP